MNTAGQILVAALDAALMPEKNKIMRMTFLNCGMANTKIRELEKKLGLEHGPMLLKVRAANRRIAELEARLAAKPSSSGAVVDWHIPSAPPVASRTIAPAPPPKAAHPCRDLMLESIQQISAIEGLEKFERMNDKQIWACLEKLAYQNHVRVPGMRPDAELAETHWRTEKLTGIARTMRADRQARINRIFNIQPL